MGIDIPEPESGEIRWDLVMQVKAEIAAGTYDTPQRREEAAEALAKLLLPED